MSLALEPQLLILDEPTQGLANAEIDTLCQRVREIADHVTVVIIEHNMPVVLELAHCITVMERGAVLAEGEPAQIASDPQVQRAYLGT
jgi:branched-chain amino acid transport system ATP-binding protein